MRTVFLIGVGLALTATALAAQDEKISWSFESDAAGQLPKGFTNEAGKWEIVADNSAPSKPHVLAQVAKSPVAAFNLILANETDYRDVDVTVKVEAIAGNSDQGGGIVWRAKDAKNYYLARYNPLEDNYRLYHVVNGSRSELKTADIPHTPGWHTLQVIMTGDHIQCFYDGKKYLEARDSTFNEPGKIGLWTKADAQTYFNNFMASGSK